MNKQCTNPRVSYYYLYSSTERSRREGVMKRVEDRFRDKKRKRQREGEGHSNSN